MTGSYSLKVITCAEHVMPRIGEHIQAFKNGSVIKLMLKSIYFLPIGQGEDTSTLYSKMEKLVLLAISCSCMKAKVTKKLVQEGTLFRDLKFTASILKI